MKSRFAGLLAVSLLTLVSAGRGAAIYSTFGPGNSFDMNDFVSFTSSIGGPTNGYADEFFNPTTFQVQSVSLALDGAGAGAAVSLTIQSNSASGPGAIIGNFTLEQTPTQPGIVTFNAIFAFDLLAGSSYWVTASTSNGRINWFENDQGINSNTASRIGTAITSGWTVNGSGPALAFEVESLPEPGIGALCVLAGSAIVLRLRAKAWRRVDLPFM